MSNIGLYFTIVIASCNVINLLRQVLPRRQSQSNMLVELKSDIIAVVSDHKYIDEWFATKPYALRIQDDEMPDRDAMAKVLCKKTGKKRYLRKKWLELILPAIESLGNEGYSKLVIGLD